MKIEMGESLFYSWLRQVKECQIVQTNWKVSRKWNLLHEPELLLIKEETEKFFHEKHEYEIPCSTNPVPMRLSDRHSLCSEAVWLF